MGAMPRNSTARQALCADIDSCALQVSRRACAQRCKNAMRAKLVQAITPTSLSAAATG